MSEKELNKVTLTDLWKEYKSLEDFWQEEAVKEFRKVYIESAFTYHP